MQSNEVKAIYMQIVSICVQEIESGKLLPGDIFPSEITLSKKFNVSRGTVRKALAELQNMGYLVESQRGKSRRVALPAHKKAGSLSKKIALLLPSKKEFFFSIIETTKDCVDALGWEVDVLFSDERNEWDIVSEIIEKRFDGALIMPYYAKDVNSVLTFDRLLRAKIPFVLLCKPLRSLICDAVFVDDYIASYKMTKGLIDKKCYEIVHITDSRMNHMVRQDRLDGYRDMILKWNRRELVFDFCDSKDKERFYQFVESQTKKIGINSYNNVLYSEANQILKSLKRQLHADYESVAFFEQALDDGGRIDFVYVPKEKLVRRAIDLLNERFIGGETEYIQHEMFNVEQY